MNSKHPCHNKECKSDEHTKHLCYFVSYGYHADNWEEYKDLVEEPRFQCHFCGRKSVYADGLVIRPPSKTGIFPKRIR